MRLLRLFMRDSVEEKILTLGERKGGVAAAFRPGSTGGCAPYHCTLHAEWTKSHCLCWRGPSSCTKTGPAAKSRQLSLRLGHWQSLQMNSCLRRPGSLSLPWVCLQEIMHVLRNWSLPCRNGTSARGPWLLEEILRWGTERLFNSPAEQPAHRAGPSRDAVGAPRPDPKPDSRAAEQAAAMETEGQADAAAPAAADKGSNADNPADCKAEAGGEPPPVMNEASAYSDEALDALIRWGTGASGGDASSGEVPIKFNMVGAELALLFKMPVPL